MTLKRTFSYLFCLSLLLFGLQLLNTASFLASSLNHARFTLPWITYKQLAYCLCSHLFLLILLNISLSFSTLGLVRVCQRRDPFLLMLLIWMLATLSLFAANQVFYPQSQYAILSSTLLSDGLARAFYTVSALLLSSLCLLGIVKQKQFVYCLLSLVPLIFLHLKSSLPIPPKQYDRPDIIVLGIDSLRMGQLHHAPYLNRLLRQSTIFTQAETPLARTFPAWVSILTGLYPFHHGARFNLTDSNSIQTQSSLAWTLKKEGYQTLYASDEKRFSRIGKAFGFDTLIGPKTGVNDFIQSQLNDMPLSNLIINTPLGKWLFPYNHSNRASYVHYYPSTFTKALDNGLIRLSPRQPLLLSLHLTLTHWPLIWGQTKQSALHHEKNLYRHALSTLDKQLQAIVDSLKNHNRLSHAILILLSDHGDAVLEPLSRLTDKAHYRASSQSPFMRLLAKQGKTLDKSFGHGTDLLSPKQTHILLAFNCYGLIHCPIKHINTPVSLIDINPTIATFLNLKKENTDGVSLFPLLHGKSLPDRVLLSETGFDPDQRLGMTLQTDKAKINTVITLAKQFYRVNQHDHVVLKKESINKMMRQKQVAAHSQHWILALYPNGNHYLSVLLNTKTLAWTDDMKSQFAQDAPIQLLQEAIKRAFPFTRNRSSSV